MTPALRSARGARLSLAVIGFAAVGCTSTSVPTAIPATAVSTMAATPAPSALPRPTLDANAFAGVPPLPADLVLPPGDFVVQPQSPRGLVLGEPITYDLGHCGIYSPVDLDGSLWEPVGGVDAQGGPIDTDQEVGVLINGTQGEAMLAYPERLDWRAGRAGVVVVFRRLEGERSYPGCQ